MRVFTMIGAASLLAGCASWQVLNTDDMIGDAKERSARTSEANVLANRQEETFGGLAAYPGQTFWGTPTDADGTPSADALADVQGWAWSQDGKQIIIKHALEDASYGGTTHVYPNGVEDELGYTYVTNAGFETVGTFTLDEDGGWEAVEVVDGHPTISHVRSRGYQAADGTLISEADYLSDGEWSRGHGFVYRSFDGDVPALDSAGDK